MTFQIDVEIKINSMYNSSIYLQETQKEKSKPAAPAESSPAATPADDQQDEDSEPPPPSERPKPRGRRMAFSAEPYTEEDAASYVKKVRIEYQNHHLHQNDPNLGDIWWPFVLRLTQRMILPCTTKR